MAEAIQLSPGGALTSPPPSLFAPAIDAPTQTLDEAIAEAQQQPAPAAPMSSLQQTQAQLQNPQNVDWVAQLQQNQARLQQRNVPRTYAPAVDEPLTDVGPPPAPNTGGFGTAVAGSFLNSLGSMATGTGALIRQDPVSNLALTAAANFQSLLQGKGQTPDWLAPAQQGLRAVNEPVAAPFEAAGKSLREAGGKQFEQLAPELKAAFNASIAGTDLFGGAPDPKTGKIPTPSDVGWGNYAEANAAGLLGWFASLPLPIGVFGRTLGTIAKTGATAVERAASSATIRNFATNTGLFTGGGAQAVGGVYEKLIDEVSKVPDQELQEKSPGYKKLRETMDETQARQAAVDASMPTFLTFVTGGAANLALGQAIPGIRGSAIALPSSRLGAAGFGAAEAGAGMGLGVGSAEAATQYGEKAMGLREGYDPGRIALGAGLGFAGGAALGGGVGAVMGGHAPPAKAIPTVDPAVAAAMAASTKPAEPTTPADFGIGAPPAAEPALPVTPTPPIPPRQPFAPTPRPVQQEPTRPGDFGIGAPPAQPTTPGDFGIGAPPTAPRDFAAEGRPQSAPPPTPAPPPPLAPGDFAISRPPVAEAAPPPAAAVPVGAPRPAPFDIPARDIPTRPEDFGVGAPPPEPPPPPPMTAPEQFGIGRPPGSEAPPAPPGPPRPQPFPAGGRAIEVSLPTRPEDFGVGAPERPATVEAIPTREAAPAATPSPFAGMNRDQLLNVATRAGMPAETLRPLGDAQIRTMLDEALARGTEQRVAAEGAAPAGETAAAPAAAAPVARTEAASAPVSTPAPIGARPSDGMSATALKNTLVKDFGENKGWVRTRVGKAGREELAERYDRLKAEADTRDAEHQQFLKDQGVVLPEPKVAAEVPTVGTETPIAALRTTEGVTVHPDDVNKGRFVAKNPAGEVIGKGLSAAEARADAYVRRGEVYGQEAPAKPAAPGLVKLAEARARQVEKAAAAKATRDAAAAERAAAEAEVIAQRRQQEQAETQAQTKAAEAQRSREIAEEGPAGQRKVPERGTTQAERDTARGGPRGDSVVDDAWLDRDQDRTNETELPAQTQEGTQPLAPTVTNTRKIGRNIVKRYKEDEFADDPAAAADAFPTRADTPEEKAKGGQPAAHTSLVDYLNKEIARLEDPLAQQEVINKVAELNDTRPANRDEGNRKARRSASLNLEMRQFDLENIEALKTMREEVSQALASREGKTLNAPAPRQERTGPWGTRRGVTSEQLSKPVQDAFAGRTSTSMHSLLSAFSNNPYVRSHAPQLAAFARWLQNALPQTLQVHRTTDPDIVGQYKYGGREADHVLLRGNLTFDQMLHEASHPVTARFFDQMQPGSREHRVLALFGQELGRIRDAARDIGVSDPFLDYALQDWHELHTMLATSSDLYRLLSQMEGSPQFKAGLAALGYAEKSRNLWQSLVKFIRRGLGMPQSFTNIMDHALRPVQDIFTAAHEYNLANLDRSVWTMADPNALEKLHGAFQNEITQNVQAQERQLNAPNPVSYVRQAWDDSALTKRGPWDWMRPKLLQVMTDYGISKYYEPLFTKDGRSLLTVAREIRNATQNLQMEEYKRIERIEPTVLDLSARLRDNKPVSTLLVDATRAEARLYSTDPEANAHLTTKEQQDRLTELKQEYAKLTPEGQKLYQDTTRFLGDLYAKEREAKLDGVVGVIAPDAPQAARDQLKAELRTEQGIQRILANSKTSDDLAAALAIPGTLVRAITQFHRMGFVRGDYFPLRRFGEYVLINGDRQSADYSVQMFEHRSEAEAARKEMASARDKQGNYLYPDLQQITTKKQITDRRGADLANPILDELNNRVTAHYGADQAKAIHDMLTSIMLQHMTRSEATRTRLRRQGVEGASYDAARVIASDAQAATWRIGYYTHGLERAKALRDMEVHVSELQRGITPRDRELQAQIDAVVKAGGDATALRQEVAERAKLPRPSMPEAAIARQVLNEEIARQPAADDPSMRAGGRIIGKITHGTYVHSLLSLSNAIVNTVEAHAAATAFIGARHGFASTGIQLGRAVAEMLPEGVKQMKELGQKVLPMWEKQLRAADWDISKVMFDRLDFPHKEALRTAARAANLIDAGGTLSRSLRQIANPGMVSGTKLGRGWDMFMDMSSILGHVSEEASKIAILKVAFEAEMKKNDNNVNKSVAYALNELEKAVPNYRGKARLATPQGALGQYGPATMQFRNYGFHITSVLATLGREALRGENASEARWALGGLFMMHAGLAGTFNWLADPLRILGGAYDLVTGEKRPYAKPALEAGARSFATKMLGPTIAEMVTRGLPHAGGYGGDVSHRLGLNNVFGLPDIANYRDPASWLGAIGTAAIGAPGATVSDAASAVSLLTSGRYMDAVKKVMPRLARDVYQAGELYTQGIKDPQGRTTLPAERVPFGAPLVKAIGINPAAVAEFREQRGNMVLTRQRTEDIRHDILNSYAQAKNKNAMNSVMQQVKTFNTGIGKYAPIPYAALTAQTRDLARSLADPSAAGLNISPRRRDIYDAGGAYNFPGRRAP